MGNNNDFNVQLLSEFATTMAELGWKPEDIAKLLKRKDVLSQLLPIIQQKATMNVSGHFINCDLNPPLLHSSNWKVEENKKDGELTWNPAALKLKRWDPDQCCKPIKGFELRKKLDNEKILNANVLFYLLQHPTLIPEEWKKNEEGKENFIFFWGTIYKVGGLLTVCYLYFRDDHWQMYFRDLYQLWNVDSHTNIDIVLLKIEP